MQLVGQDCPHCAAQVSQEAVEKGQAFSRTAPQRPAPLVHQPKAGKAVVYHFDPTREKNYWDQLVQPRATYREQESSRSSAARQLRPTGTHSWLASLERQVEAESTQKSTSPERSASRFLTVTAPSVILALKV